MGAMEGMYEHCADEVRRLDRDRFLSALLAPEPARRHILALYAFNLEVARVRELVSNPMPGEIRLQWWRDALTEPRKGEAGSHPVAAALIDTVARFNLPVQALLNLIEARVFDLYDDPMPTLADLEGYAGETASTLIQLAAIVLAEGHDPGTHDLAGHAGVAHAVTGLLRALPFHAARGQVYLPKDLLARHGAGVDDVLARRATREVRAALAELREVAQGHLVKVREGRAAIPPAVAPAFLPLALIEPYLKRLARPGLDPLRDQVELPQWLRPLLLWRAAGRVPR